MIQLELENFRERQKVYPNDDRYGGYAILVAPIMACQIASYRYGRKLSREDDGKQPNYAISTYCRAAETPRNRVVALGCLICYRSPRMNTTFVPIYGT